MNFYEHACVVLVWYVISFFYIRLTLAGIISYQLNNSTLKKRKQGQSVREWFLYKIKDFAMWFLKHCCCSTL